MGTWSSGRQLQPCERSATQAWRCGGVAVSVPSECHLAWPHTSECQMPAAMKGAVAVALVRLLESIEVRHATRCPLPVARCPITAADGQVAFFVHYHAYA